MNKMHLICPYCGQEMNVEPPTGKEYEYEPEEGPFCLPYTRDIGKFDPKPEFDILSSSCWSDKRIGKDYLSFINFERFGILRIEQKGINVRYRVQKCIKCENLFDVFVNYTEGKSLEEIWPHLFSKDPVSHGIQLYQGENFSIRLVQSVGSLVKSNLVSVFILHFKLVHYNLKLKKFFEHK